MTREQRIEAYTMILDGFNNKEIAAAIGVNEKAINKEFPRSRVKKVKCNFVGLRKWLNENEVSLYKMAKLIKPNIDSGNWFYKKMRGETVLTIVDINKIIEITGLTYEELFSEVDE